MPRATYRHRRFGEIPCLWGAAAGWL